MASKNAGEASKGTEYKLKWQLLSPSGPAMMHHVGCLIGNCLYVHGGVDKNGSIDPLNTMYKMDLGAGIWDQVRSPGSPALSNHACVVLENRYILLIGGWNGKKRASSVYGFDTEKQEWIECETSGFPEGAGLSSHTANLLTNGDVIVAGREGSLRLQRRSGQAFMLRGDIHKKQYKWSDVPLHVDSRSGHTTHLIGQILISFGGRNDKPLELHQGFKGAYRSAEPSNEVISKIWNICKQLKSMTKPPGGRKNHVGIDGGGGILYHGGETFDGKSRVPVGDMFMLAVKPHVQWYKLGDSGLSRAGHVTCASSEKVIIQGGMSGKGTIHSDCYELQVDEVK